MPLAQLYIIPALVVSLWSLYTLRDNILSITLCWETVPSVGDGAQAYKVRVFLFGTPVVVVMLGLPRFIISSYKHIVLSCIHLSVTFT